MRRVGLTGRRLPPALATRHLAVNLYWRDMLPHVRDAPKPVPPFISGYLSRERIGRPRLRRAVAGIYSGSESASRATPGRLGSFVLRHSFVILSSFVIRASSFLLGFRSGL